MISNSNMKAKISEHMTSAPVDDSWIQPSTTLQSFFTKNQKLIDGVYMTVTTYSPTFFDAELGEIEIVALADFWNIEQSED